MRFDRLIDGDPALDDVAQGRLERERVGHLDRVAAENHAAGAVGRLPRRQTQGVALRRELLGPRPNTGTGQDGRHGLEVVRVERLDRVGAQLGHDAAAEQHVVVQPLGRHLRDGRSENTRRSRGCPGRGRRW